MRAARWVPIVGATGVCLLGAPLLRSASTPVPAQQPAIPAAMVAPLRIRSPSDRVLRTAVCYRRRALLAVKRELEAMDAWDPEGMARDADERWRQEQLARDRSGGTAAERGSMH